MEMLPERMEEGNRGHDHIQQSLADRMELVGWEEFLEALLEEDLLPELGEEENLKVDEVDLMEKNPVSAAQMCSEEERHGILDEKWVQCLGQQPEIMVKTENLEDLMGLQQTDWGRTDHLIHLLILPLADEVNLM